jgi:type II secretory pathway component PulJ
MTDPEKAKEKHKIEARMRRAVLALERDLLALEEVTGRRLGYFAESGRLYVIDSDLDVFLCDKTNAGYRGQPVEDGGSVVANLHPDHVSGHFDGGGW